MGKSEMISKMAGKQAGSSMNLLLLVGLLLCGADGFGVVDPPTPVPCMVLIDQGDTSFTGVLYASTQPYYGECIPSPPQGPRGCIPTLGQITKETGSINLDEKSALEKEITKKLAGLYKEAITTMLEQAREGGWIDKHHYLGAVECEATKIGIRQTGKIRDALLKDLSLGGVPPVPRQISKDSPEDAWVTAMDKNLKKAMKG